MKVVIIEDEKPAVEKLEMMLREYDPEIEVIARFGSVIQTVDWIKNSGMEADLFFMDILLTDGQSFDIFDQVEINKPVIFITAYNEYAIKAFKVNSIDYLQKPLNYEDLYKSLEKMKVLRENLPANKERMRYEELSQALMNINRSFKNRFMVKVGEHIRSVKTDNIALFYAEGRTVFLITQKQHKYIVDYTLEDLVKTLDPDIFFRVNRSFIVNINTIKDVVVYSNSRLLIELNFEFEKEIIVSRERVGQLKTWFEGV